MGGWPLGWDKLLSAQLCRDSIGISSTGHRTSRGFVLSGATNRKPKSAHLSLGLRARSVKRVASGAGEGSIVVSAIHAS